MKISKRLKEIAAYIEKDSYVLDVGCDHALLDIYLIRENICKKTMASDIHEGPLKKAKENIEKYHLQEKIELKQADGIDKINDKVDTIVLAGMGYYTIKDILNKNNRALEKVNTIILSVNDDFYELRKYITNKDYRIEKEKIIEDHNKFYLILKVKKGRKKYPKKELFFGTSKMNQDSKDYKKYIEKEIIKRKRILSSLPKTKLLLKIKLKKEIRILSKKI